MKSRKLHMLQDQPRTVGGRRESGVIRRLLVAAIMVCMQASTWPDSRYIYSGTHAQHYAKLWCVGCNLFETERGKCAGHTMHGADMPI